MQQQLAQIKSVKNPMNLTTSKTQNQQNIKLTRKNFTITFFCRIGRATKLPNSLNQKAKKLNKILIKLDFYQKKLKILRLDNINIHIKINNVKTTNTKYKF